MQLCVTRCCVACFYEHLLSMFDHCDESGSHSPQMKWDALMKENRNTNKVKKLWQNFNFHWHHNQHHHPRHHSERNDGRILTFINAINTSSSSSSRTDHHSSLLSSNTKYCYLCWCWCCIFSPNCKQQTPQNYCQCHRWTDIVKNHLWRMGLTWEETRKTIECSPIHPQRRVLNQGQGQMLKCILHTLCYY